jgi:hypothetical protein
MLRWRAPLKACAPHGSAKLRLQFYPEEPPSVKAEQLDALEPKSLWLAAFRRQSREQGDEVVGVNPVSG